MVHSMSGYYSSEEPENMREKTVIRIAEERDVSDIYEIQREGWLNTYPNEKLGITQEDIRANMEMDTKDSRITAWNAVLQSDGNHVLIATIGEQAAGFCVIQNTESDSHLSSIYVYEKFHGRGVGTDLWNVAKKFVSVGKAVIVEVASYNENAIQFYEKIGFKFYRSSGDHTTKNGIVIPCIEMIYLESKTIES